MEEEVRWIEEGPSGPSVASAGTAEEEEGAQDENVEEKEAEDEAE